MLVQDGGNSDVATVKGPPPMGMYHSTYHAFGVHVPESKYLTRNIDNEGEWLDAVIRNTPELDGKHLGYLTAGAYDRDQLFLTVVGPGEDVDVELGRFMALADVDVTGRADAIKALAGAAGYEGLSEPGWLVIPDLS